MRLGWRSKFKARWFTRGTYTGTVSGVRVRATVRKKRIVALEIWRPSPTGGCGSNEFVPYEYTVLKGDR